MPIETIIKESSEVSGPGSVDDAPASADPDFNWREHNGVKALVCRPLEDAGFVNGFSTRLGGVSPFPSGDLNLAGFNEDSAENIYENRRRFLSLFDGDRTLATVWQVHGDAVKVIRTADDIGNSEDKADAVISNIVGVLAGVKTADCVPVLIGDPVTGAFAAIHAGWRGTVQSIVFKTVGLLTSAFGSRPEGMIGAIGPAACGRKYEIGQDVIDAFAAGHPNFEKYFTPTREGHALVDLHQANSDQLANAGVPISNIHVSSLCTIERNDLFFSYRVEKRKFGRTGRLMSVIGRGKTP